MPDEFQPVEDTSPESQSLELENGGTEPEENPEAVVDAEPVVAATTETPVAVTPQVPETPRPAAVSPYTRALLTAEQTEKAQAMGFQPEHLDFMAQMIQQGVAQGHQAAIQQVEEARAMGIPNELIPAVQRNMTRVPVAIQGTPEGAAAAVFYDALDRIQAGGKFADEVQRLHGFVASPATAPAAPTAPAQKQSVVKTQPVALTPEAQVTRSAVGGSPVTGSRQVEDPIERKLRILVGDAA